MSSDEIQEPPVPTDLLLIEITRDGTVEIVRHFLATKRNLSFADLQLLEAYAGGEIADTDAALTEFLTAAGHDEDQQKDLVRLARGLEHTSRLARRQPYDAAGRVGRDGYSVDSVPDGPVDLCRPLAFRFRGPLLETVDHSGARLPHLTVAEFHALSRLVEHPDPVDAIAAHRELVGDHAIDLAQFREVLAPFVDAGLLVAHSERSLRNSVDLSQNILAGESTDTTRQRFRHHAEELDEAERQRTAASGAHRPRVIPVAFDMCPPAALGALVAYAKVYEDHQLDEFYNFRTDWVWDDDRADFFSQEPAIYIFSNYLWSHKRCIEVSEKVKALNPNNITIHGGPDTPKYLLDQKRYFKEHPHVDIAIRGEGELSFAETMSRLRRVIGDDQPDLGVLEGCEGVTYRSGDGIVVNEDRGRIVDLDVLPSPYLTGLFDTYMGTDDLFVIFETNRGCPYGCTFCDWGSATASRIRQFDMDRVMAELEWAAKAQVSSVSVADANYGIFARDVDIARKAAELKRTTGFPRGFGGNYAKNTVKHLKTIIEVLAEGNILTLGTLSLQSMDEDTLDAIHRSNIKTEKYDAMAIEMSKSDLPLMIELMMGLPGSTTASFREDLQQCIDRELPARVNMTTLLVNSPMNDPEYLAEHKIKTSVPLGPGKLALLSSTASYTEEDLAEMSKLRSVFMLFENYGVLRVVSRFIRQETDVDEMTFYHRLLADTENVEPWPTLHVVTTLGPSMMAPPISWSLAIDELKAYIETTYGLADSPALRSVLASQLACIPAHGRDYSKVIELECDVVAWHRAMVAEKEAGNRREWDTALPRLETYGPGSVTVSDPHGLTETALGINQELNSFGVNWELESPLHRARADLN